ncbi:MAG TPA: hypothetical protein VFI46_11570 [Jiangellaceae bacterium]|nr:hypothetical protein [Jiangellaceae bacterium]
MASTCEVTLVGNDWGGAQLLVTHGRDDRVARLVLVACEAFDNYPPGIPGRLAHLSAIEWNFAYLYSPDEQPAQWESSLASDPHPSRADGRPGQGECRRLEP